MYIEHLLWARYVLFPCVILTAASWEAVLLDRCRTWALERWTLKERVWFHVIHCHYCAGDAEAALGCMHSIVGTPQHAQVFGLNLQNKWPDETWQSERTALLWSCGTQDPLSYPVGRAVPRNTLGGWLTVTVTKGCSALAGHSHPVYKLMRVNGDAQLGKFPFEKCSKALLSNPVLGVLCQLVSRPFSFSAPWFLLRSL